MTAALILTPDPADMVRELTDRVTHRERLEHRRVNRDGTVTIVRAVHATRHPSLLAQLGAAVEPSQATSAQEGARPGFASAPSARLDAIDALLKIDAQAGSWVSRLGGSRGDTATNVRRAAALGVGNRSVEHAVQHWWTRARVVTGWDSPAWRPDATCPLCGKRGGLRVRVLESVALCVECEESWSPDTIGLLAEHIRAESEAKPEPHERACEPFMVRVAVVDEVRAAERTYRPMSAVPVVLRGMTG